MKASLWQKGVLGCIIMLCMIVNAFSQEDKKEFYFDINGGVSLPVQEFKNDVFGDGYFASTGSVLDFDVYLGFSNYMTLLYSLDYSYIPFNEDSYLEEYKRVLNVPDGIQVNANDYQFLNSMFGLGFRTLQHHNFQLFYTIKLGYSVCFHPEISVFADEVGQINYLTSDIAGRLSMAHEAKLSYFVNKKIGLNLVYSSVRFRPRLINTEDNITYRILVRYVNLGVGVTYKLNWNKGGDLSVSDE